MSCDNLIWSDLVLNCRPLLRRIKELLGGDDKSYLAISSSIVKILKE